MSKRKFLAIITIILIVGFLAGYLVRLMKPFMFAYAISKIEMVKPLDTDEYGNPKTVWRIYGSTEGTGGLNLQRKEWTINASVLEQYGALPENMTTQSSITVKIENYRLPYWSANVEPVANIRVTTNVTAERTGAELHTEYAVDELWVSLYRVKSASRQLHIPFRVQIYKTYPSGEKVTLQLVDFPMGAYKFDEKEQVYYFDFTDVEFALGQVPKELHFVNPYNTAENITVRLSYPFGIPSFEYPQQDFILVCNLGVPEVFSGENTFLYEKLDDLRKLIDYDLGYDWRYANYWFGTANSEIWKAHTVVIGQYGVETHTGHFINWGTDKGEYSNTIRPVVEWGGLIKSYTFIAEGYGSSINSWVHNYIKETSWAYEYPGWYCPDGTEGLNFSEPWNWRIPRMPSVISDVVDAKPYGLSLVNYIESTDVVAPVSGEKKTEFVSPERIEDYWIHGWSFNSSSMKMYYYLPTPDSYAWSMILDVSADIVDAIYVIEETRANPRFIWEQCSYPSESEVLAFGQEYPVVLTVVNDGDYGDVYVGIMIPEGSPPIAVRAEMGFAKRLEHNETATFTLYIKNIANLAENTQGKYKIITTNGYEVTDYREVVWTLGPTVTSYSTVVNVKVLEYESDNTLAWMKVTVFDVETKGTIVSESGDTDSNGLAQFNLGTFEGDIKIRVEDPEGEYKADPKTVYVKPQSEPYEVKIYMYKGEQPPDFWEFIEEYLPYIIGGGLGATGIIIAVYALKRRWYYGGISY
jgi:hypothetical protein